MKVVQTVINSSQNLVSEIGSMIKKIGSGLSGLLGIGGIGLSSVPGMTAANTAGMTGIGGLIAKNAIAAGAAGTGITATGGTAVAGGGLLAGISGALPILAGVAGIGLGAVGLVNNIKKIKETMQDDTKTGGQKFASVAGRLALSAFFPIVPIVEGISGLFKKHHTGADYVKKGNPLLDKMLGLGNDETVSVLKVGEAVVPTWANSASSSASGNRFTGSPFGSAVDTAVKSARASSRVSQTSGEQSVSISIPINIQGDADASTVKALKEVRKDIVNDVMKTINNQTRIGGYKNIKAATV